MGGATYICSDKTGTLTKNEMTVMAIMAQNKIYEMGNEISDKLVKNTKAALEENGFWQTLLEGIMWNSSARIEQNQDKES
jgi:P-type E1-E2 ATPase